MKTNIIVIITDLIIDQQRLVLTLTGKRVVYKSRSCWNLIRSLWQHCVRQRTIIQAWRYWMTRAPGWRLLWTSGNGFYRNVRYESVSALYSGRTTTWTIQKDRL